MALVDKMTREQLLQAQASARVYQARADSVFQEWGFRAPAPSLGQHPEDYRRDLAVMAKKQLPYGHELRKVKLWKLPRDAFEVMEPQVYAACKQAASRPDSVAPGEMREVTRINPQNGHKEIHFLGTTSFVKEFTRPGRRVTSFRTDHGYVDVSGRPLR
jgi:hypothetical protein